MESQNNVYGSFVSYFLDRIQAIKAIAALRKTGVVTCRVNAYLIGSR